MCNNPLNLPPEQYKCLWPKCIEYKAFSEQQELFNKKYFDLLRKFLYFSVQHELRSPWLISEQSRNIQFIKDFMSFQSEKEKFESIKNTDLIQYLKQIYQDRINIIKIFSQEETVKNFHTMNFYSGKSTIFLYVSTFIIPSIFGHFEGQKNIEDFIEAVGQTFDVYADDKKETDDFLLKFNNSFLCWVLRQFFFSPLVRPYIGEQFTAFFDFFRSKKTSESQFYLRIQRFISHILHELEPTLSSGPHFILSLFKRLTQKFPSDENPELNLKYKVILTILLYCIIIPLTTYPTAFSVIPPTNSYTPETREKMTAIKYFCAVNFNLPIPDGANPLKPVKESELLEKDEIFNLCKTILQPTIKPPINEKHVSCIAAPYSAIELLIKLEKDQTKLSKLLNALSSEEIQSNSIVYITFDDSLHFTDDSHQIMAQHVIDIVSQKHYETQSTLSPRLYALQRWINKTRPNFDEILQTIIDMNETKLQEIIDVQCCFIQIERSIELTQKAISTTNYIFADRISTTIYNEIERKLEKKVTLMMEDSTVFSKYVISKLESYYSKNQWLTSLLPMVARRFHSLIMQSFPLPLFAQVHKNQIILDQKFLNQKANLLQKLEGNELDPSVAKIVQNKSMFNPAQTPILRACLYENPIESVRQIVLSLCAVEDLFVFEYGTQPEANQLMPLLANLFILTPIPSPLMFGKWLAHFLQNLQQMKPEWFSDEELRPLEHYFQFNAWMEDMLQSFDE